ncbi:MAG: hypothetical protein ACLF0G_01695 [Candidatus Brocadiia bacterium]
MARASPTMEMFLVGAYLRLVEGCHQVRYNAELMDPKEYWVNVCGRSEARQCIVYVDFAEKFDWFPPEMRPDTLVKKLVRRYRQMAEQGEALDYAPSNVHCQVWLPRPPARRIAEALPKVRQRLRERHGIELEVVDPQEFARRIPPLVERIEKLSFDYDNLFIRGLLLSRGRLDYRAGAPMGAEQIEAMYRFPAALASAVDVPRFIHQFLASGEVVDWLGFDSYSFDEMRQAVVEAGATGELEELAEALAHFGDPVDPMLDGDHEEAAYLPRRYSAAELAELTRLLFAGADEFRAVALSTQGSFAPLEIEIDFMLPFLSRAQRRIDPSQIEREILLYGGDRDQMMAHFAAEHPPKLPYRAILRVELYEPGGERLPPYPGGSAMEVPIRNPALTHAIHAAVTLNYAIDFTGYFVLMMHRVAARLDL